MGLAEENSLNILIISAQQDDANTIISKLELINSEELWGKTKLKVSFVKTIDEAIDLIKLKQYFSLALIDLENDPQLLERYQLEQTLDKKVRELESSKKYIERLKHSNKELESFAHAASHDMKEPLRKVIAFGDRLVDVYSEKLDEKGKDYIERMQKATRRMEKLLDDLLEYSKMSSKEFKIETFDLNKILKAVISDLEVTISEARAKIDWEALPQLEVDKGQIYRVFLNLISNALKFRNNNKAPEIKITAHKTDDNYYQICIRDNGIGIEEEYHEEIFREFQRLYSKDEYEGSGLGLATVKKIIERHNGQIWVESEYGEYSSFIFKLPISSEKFE